MLENYYIYKNLTWFMMETIINKSDFKITATLKPLQDNNTLLNPLEFEWTIYYYTNKYRKFTASHTLIDGVSTLSPGVSINNGTITIQVDGFDFQYEGLLKRAMKVTFPDPSLEDGKRTISVKESLLDIQIRL